MKSLFFSLAASLMLALPVLSQAQQISKTVVEQGEIEGVVHDGYVLYPAIPYAEAHVGDLRWKAPVPKKPWQGVYRAEKFAPQPPQPGRGVSSEDCLYLSVQTPAKSKDDKLPVFVMIHGGAFLTGSYAGTQDSFVKEGIVYVSIEYRLGVLGFFSHPELSKESPNGVSGNQGILDQICALKWVHNNIAAFGGDPDNITIAGESAGGISVSILCASPMCKGLFKRAISESGSSFCPISDLRTDNIFIGTAKGMEQNGLEFQKKMGAKNLKALRNLPVEKLVSGTNMEEFWPVVDGIAIADDQYKLYESGNYNDVDILIGTNSDEGWMFTRETSVEDFESHIRGTFGDFADRLLAMYPVKTPAEVHFALADIFRDGHFAWGTYAWANLQSAKSDKNVYLYYFDQNSGGFMGSPRGANHVAEMPFVYGWGTDRFSDVEKSMSQIMSQYWINFVKTGNPNAPGLPFWTTYKQGAPTVMHFRDGFRLVNVPNQEQLNFFEDFFKSRR